METQGIDAKNDGPLDQPTRARPLDAKTRHQGINPKHMDLWDSADALKECREHPNR